MMKIAFIDMICKVRNRKAFHVEKTYLVILVVLIIFDVKQLHIRVICHIRLFQFRLFSWFCDIENRILISLTVNEDK